MRTLSTVALFLALATGVTEGFAEVKTREFQYQAGDVSLQGFMAWDDAVKGKRPGVLVVHEWWGHNDHARNAARKLAQAGYVGFALDLFGQGKVTTHPEDAQAFIAEATKDPDALMARFNAALTLLKQDANVDPTRIGAIGYCFGGGVVLNRARAGEDLDAVVTFHGALSTKTAAKKGEVKPRILVLTGGADSMIPSSQVDQFKQEMKNAGAKYEVVVYPGAKHGFTNPNAGKAGLEALAYNADADRKSWAKAMDFLRKAF